MSSIEKFENNQQISNCIKYLVPKSGDQNLYVENHDNKINSTLYKIYLRSAHHYENGILLNSIRFDVLSESFGEGDHVGAVSLYMKKEEENFNENQFINDILLILQNQY